MKAGLRDCLNRGLATDPNEHGALRVVIDVGPRGDVTDARTELADGFGRETIECVLRRVKSATFVPPEPAGSRATIALPMKFEVSDRVGPVPR